MIGLWDSHETDLQKEQAFQPHTLHLHYCEDGGQIRTKCQGVCPCWDALNKGYCLTSSLCEVVADVQRSFWRRRRRLSWHHRLGKVNLEMPPDLLLLPWIHRMYGRTCWLQLKSKLRANWAFLCGANYNAAGKQMHAIKTPLAVSFRQSSLGACGCKTYNRGMVGQGWRGA